MAKFVINHGQGYDCIGEPIRELVEDIALTETVKVVAVCGSLWDDKPRKNITLNAGECYDYLGETLRDFVEKECDGEKVTVAVDICPGCDVDHPWLYDENGRSFGTDF